jgi:hypothetical protein
MDKRPVFLVTLTVKRRRDTADYAMTSPSGGGGIDQVGGMVAGVIRTTPQKNPLPFAIESQKKEQVCSGGDIGNKFAVTRRSYVRDLFDAT